MEYRVDKKLVKASVLRGNRGLLTFHFWDRETAESYQQGNPNFLILREELDSYSLEWDEEIHCRQSHRAAFLRWLAGKSDFLKLYVLEDGEYPEDEGDYDYDWYEDDDDDDDWGWE